MKSLLLSTAIVSTLLAFPVLADVIAPDSDTSGSNEIVVVANRSPERLDRIGSSVTVLDQATIHASQATAVSDLLAETPGVTFIRNGGLGENTSILIRGADTDQTVVLIDGVKLNDPSSPGGALNYGHLLLGDIGRIEVLRGPQSTLWGSDAMGGVVNILTNKATGPFNWDLQAEGGSRAQAYVRGGVGGISEFVDWRVAGGYLSTSGISALDKKYGGVEKDPYRNYSTNATALVRLTDTISLDIRGYYINARNSFDDAVPAPSFALGDSPSYGEVEDYVAYAGLNVDLFDGALKNRVSFEYTESNTHNYNPSLKVPLTFVGIGRNTRFEYQGTWAIAEGYEAVFGAESQRSRINTYSPTVTAPTPNPTNGNADIDSVYAQVRGTVLPGLTLTAGGRGDHHNTAGDHGTGQAAAAWVLNDGTTILRATFGQGFKAPSLYQLFSQYGNKGLKPQQDDGWDAGIEQHFLDGRVMFQATYFGRDTNNIISFVSCFGNTDPRCKTQPNGFYNNTAKAEAEGVELEGSAKLFEGFSVAANYTYAESEDRSPGSATFGKDLTRRPRNAANASATYVWPFGLSTTAALRYSGRSFDNTINTNVLGSYTVVDLRTSYPLTENFELYGRIENLFDKQYETALRYGELGRGVFAGVTGKF